jgi:hypothetical protein
MEIVVYVKIYNSGTHHNMLFGYNERKRRMWYKRNKAPSCPKLDRAK